MDNQPTITPKEQCLHTSVSSNLTALPFMGRFLRHPLMVGGLQVCSVVLLGLAISVGIFSEDRRDGLTVLLFWGIFWPLLTCITTPSLGPVFCAICPHGAMGKWLQKFGLKRRFPKSLRGAWIGMSLLLLGYWILAFAAPSLLSASTKSTAWYFLLFTIFAAICFVLYADMAYCKHICPLGRVLAVHGKAGGLVIRTDQSACSVCTTFDCAKACHYHLSPFRFEERNNMESCTLCLDCVHSCKSAELHWEMPGKKLIQPIKRTDSHDFWVLLLILAVAGVGIQFLHGLQQTGLRSILPWNTMGAWLNQTLQIDSALFKFSGLLAFLTAIGLTLAIALFGYHWAAKYAQQDRRAMALDLAYALAPLAILGLIPHPIGMFAMKSGPAIVNEIGGLLGYNWHVTAFAARGDIWLKVLNFLPWLGVLWSLWLVWCRAKLWSVSRKQQWAVWFFASLPVWLYSGVMLTKLAAFWLLPMPHSH